MKSDFHLNSLWQPVAKRETTSRKPSGALDVCIVGAGIAGLSVAYQLARAGKKVAVFDDGPVGGGNTGRTTAHLASVIDDRFTEVERVRGVEFSKLAAHSHAAAIDTIEETAGREKIDCDFQRLDGYLFQPPEQRDDEQLRREAEAALRAGLVVEEVARAPLPRFDTGLCLRFPNQGQFDPMRYLTGLVRAIKRHGGQVVTDTRVSEVKGGQPATVELKKGGKIEADAVVVATNTPVNDRVTLHTKLAPYLTYAIAFQVDKGAVPRALYWDTMDPYHYVRLADGDAAGKEYLIVGGEDHKTGQATDYDARFERLTAWARERFPIGEEAYRWTGQVMETLDGLGFIGRNPGDEPNVYVATGDSGMGMTHGTIAGLLISDLILGRANPWVELYDPARKPALSLGTFLRENINAAAQYGSWVTPGEVSSADEIAKGQGAILRQGLHKLAVYRDSDGELCVRSATCPHLGGIVAWNTVEKTWDCPLHGSRFDRCGKMVNGPSNGDLEEKSL